ncbi:hypothetical protein ACETM9_003600 [Salmonella enterica]
MAAIEKVCEFSGEYPGGEMYGFKRNHIQIMPKHRKKFRGHKAVLFVFKNRLIVNRSWGYETANLDCINPNPSEADWESGAADRKVTYENGEKRIYSVFYSNLSEYKAALKKRHQRLLMQYEYILYVPDMPGDVSGCYTNLSTDMSSVIRRLRRMVGARNLTVKYKEGDCWDFMNENLIPEPHKY